MSGNHQPWKFALSSAIEERIPVLLAPRSFEEIASLVTSRLRVLCCHRSQVKGTEFRRPVYTVEVDRWLFDVLFNSPFGYRAAYFRSPGLGLDANVYLMQSVASRLIEDPLTASCELPTTLLHESLVTPSAKFWLTEYGKEIDRKCKGCKGEWGASSASSGQLAEILNGRWENALSQKAQWGRQAPYLTKLRFMGAFVDDRYAEYVPHDKRFRANDISTFGWA